jgi:glyoxylase-like metal-dependent hydrolase (beta-lactamase superfamily II)
MSAPVREEQQQAVDEVTEVAPGILRLQLPIQMPGLGHVNCYLMEDERGFAVVDPGLPGDASWAALTAGFKRAGVPLARVHTVIVTHSHPDHFGGAGQLRAETGADIVSHRLFRLMFRLNTGEEHADTNPEQLAEDDASGNPLSKPVPYGGETPWGSTPWQPMSEGERAKSFGTGRRVEPTPTFRLDEADHIMLAGRRWVALHTPGHTIDHLCLFDPEEGALLSGDHVLPTITPHISGMAEGSDPLEDYFGSLRKVAALTGVKHVLPAHGHPFVELSKRCDGIIEHHRERLTRLSDASAEMDRPGTVNDYMKFLFRERSWGSMAESETYAHLEHLRIAGQASCERHDGQLEYKVQHPLRPIDD